MDTLKELIEKQLGINQEEIAKEAMEDLEEQEQKAYRGEDIDIATEKLKEDVKRIKQEK